MSSFDKRGDKFPSSSLGFSNIKIFANRQIIKPYLNKTDSHEISERIYHANSNKKNSANNTFKKIVPQHLIDDIYQLYHTKSDKLKLETPHPTNTVKYGVIEKINNSGIKIISNDSHVGSYIFTEKISNYIYDMVSDMTPEQQEQFMKSMDECNQGNEPTDEDGEGLGYGEGEEGEEDGEGSVYGKGGKGASKQTDPNKKKFMDQAELDKQLQKRLDSKQGKDKFEQMIKEAEKVIDDLDKSGFDIHSSDMQGDKNHTKPGDEDQTKELLDNLHNLDTFKHEVKSININKDQLFKAIEKILDKSINYFSKKSHMNEVELMDAEELLDIQGIEFLHPVFQNTKIIDMSVIERKYYGKFDLYIDVSGSMSSGCGINGVSKLLFAKAMALHMRNLGILGDIYIFDTSVSKIKNSEISILLINDGGGTSFNAVTKKISETKNNSVILTDLEDSVGTHLDNVFFVGVRGASPSYLAGSAEGQKYLDGGQCIFFDGDKFTNHFERSK